MGVTKGGSLTFRYLLQEALTTDALLSTSNTITSQSALSSTAPSSPGTIPWQSRNGVASMTIGPGMFARMTQLSAVYGRCRLAGLKVWYQPGCGDAVPGEALLWIDYESTAPPANTIATFMKEQDVARGPVNAPLQVYWRKQGVEDEAFVATSNTQFNNSAPASIYFATFRPNGSTYLGYIHCSAIIEFTGLQ